MKKFKTADECFKFLKLDIKKNIPDVSNCPEKDKAAIIADYTLKKVIEAHCQANGNWKPDWKDYSQWKYYPWFMANTSGSGLSYFAFDFSRTSAYVGSRLCLPSSELAEYVGKTFIKLYEQTFLIKD